MERLFQDIPGISIEKAKQVYNLIKNISFMSKRKSVTEDDIQKAYDALGLELPEDIRKGDDPDEETEDTEETEEEDDDMDGDETDEEEDTEETDDEEEDDDKDKTEKAQIVGRLSRIEKAVATAYLQNTKYIKALGTISIQQSQNLEKAINALSLANEKMEKLEAINKAQTEEISSLRQELEAYGNSAPAPKSVRAVAAVERNFTKSQQDELNGGQQIAENQVSMRNKAAVSEILDQATFHKGYDAEFSKAVMDFEATGQVSPAICSRIKNEFGIEIIK